MFKSVYFPLLSFALIIGAIYVSFERQLPHYQMDIQADTKTFSTDRALLHLKKISEKPHYVGTSEHTHVRNYLVGELSKMGLKVEIQEQEVLNPKWNAACKTFNVLTRIEGSNSEGKALLLLTHYDSAPHSKSLGASDAGSGVVTILESVRAYLASGVKPKNDILIVFSDAEEIGLLGAKAFVDHHPWAKEVGLVLNLEARGSGGPSYMLLETNSGNAQLIQSYNKAKLSYTVGNSLMYSIYKMLPNDTDLTIFRENAHIDGFNFAFIDDHFDYHSEQDSYERLDRNTLLHQGLYMSTLLNYFADVDLNKLKSQQDLVFFNFPFLGDISYPFSWVLPIVLLAGILFFVFFLMGIKRNRVSLKESLRGFIPLISSLGSAFVLGWFGWKLVLLIKPEYKEILHGFTYNGNWFIMGFISLSIAVFWMIYKPYFEKRTLPNLLFAPILLWLVINVLIALKLKGAGFFIIPTLGMLVAYIYLVLSPKISDKSLIFFTLIALPGLMIFAPQIAMFPVGLGLKMLVVSTVLSVLLMTTLISTLDFYSNHKPMISMFLVLSFLTFGSAFLRGGFSIDQRKPNSIIYYQDVVQGKAYWATYDVITDDFTKQFLSSKPLKGDLKLPFGSKYGTHIDQYVNTEMRNLSLPMISKTINDSLYADKTILDFYIQSNRKSNLFLIQAKDSISFFKMSVNGAEYDKPLTDSDKMHHLSHKNTKICSYYLANGVDQLHLQLVVPKGQKTELELYDITFDLLENPAFKIEPRKKIMMPKPFVINDAVVLKVAL
jgi:hypothetical protein